MKWERTSSTWRGYVAQITYGTRLQSPAADSLVSRLADEILRQRYFNDPVEDYYRAVVEALRSGEQLRFDDTQNEAAVRDLLERLIPALDERKPWPEPRFTSLPVEEWSVLQDAPVLGRIPMHVIAVQAHLHRVFSERGPDGSDAQVLVLRLRTGQKVGLSAKSYSLDDVELRSLAEPASTRKAFLELTGLDVQPR
jgi:hypothetical protein